jgi:hypothetical protein
MRACTSQAVDDAPLSARKVSASIKDRSGRTSDANEGQGFAIQGDVLIICSGIDENRVAGDGLSHDGANAILGLRRIEGHAPGRGGSNCRQSQQDEDAADPPIRT